MPDLGAYADTVLASYGITLALIGALVAISFWQARRAKRALDRIERGQGG